MLKLENITQTFGALEVLKGITLDVKAGEKIVIIGPSGSGKSTFLHCMNLLQVPTGGSVTFHDRVINRPGAHDGA